MNPFLRPFCFRSSSLHHLFLLLCITTSSRAADITLNGSDANGANTSFNSAGNWSNALPPSSGNQYFSSVSTRNLRTPHNSNASFTFGGDSLTLSNGAPLVYKGAYTSPATPPVITIQDFRLDGGYVNSASDNSSPFVLAGNLTILGTGNSRLWSNNATITVSAVIKGTTGSLLLDTNNTLGRQIILTAANLYTGNINVTGNSGAILDTTGQLAFAIGSSSTFNQIGGTGPFTFNGAFLINLTGASSTIGTTYTLVNHATVVETYGTTFSVVGWTKMGTDWFAPTGDYKFSPSTGILTRIDPDTDLDGLTDSWEITYFGDITSWSGNDDADGDFCSNLSEQAANTHPNNPASFPDTDNDTLPDGWEIRFFNNLTPTPTGDPDGDFATNLAEFNALTEPNNRSSFPDDDFDLISDAWEIYYFSSTSACDPFEDPDGDLTDNLGEYNANTRPLIQASSPDLDGDGLPDGWEVKYFLAPGDGLNEATAHTDGSLDSDGDGRLDRVEYHTGTNPIIADTAPPTVAHWRFEETTAGTVAPQVATAVKDVTGNGNDLMTWADYTAPTYSTRSFSDFIPNPSTVSRASLNFTAVAGNRYVCDNLYTNATAPLNTRTFSAYTVEASFRATLGGIAQGIVGKGGNPTGSAAPYQAPFTLKLNAANKVVAGLVDASLHAREATSTRTVTVGSWYAVAVTVSHSTLSLWMKASSDSSYVLESSVPIAGAFPLNSINSVWVVGQTEFDAAGNFGGFDSFTGDLDEIRISSTALYPGRFLMNPSSEVGNPDLDADGMDDAWEIATFGSTTPTATQDFDADGTSNRAEFLLGLSGNNASSFFTSSLSSGSLTWPASRGLIFKVHRSPDLTTWTPLTTVVATGNTASYTDPSPLPGKAFYKVTLEP